MIIIIFAFYTIGICFEIATLKKYFITPSFVFVGMQIVMFSGILTYSDFDNPSDRKFMIIYLLALIMFIFGNYLSQKTKTANVRNATVVTASEEHITKYQLTLLVAMVIVSILVCFWFFYKAGYNVFLQIVLSLGSGAVNLTDRRIALNNLSGVGYVYQFRVVILPLICAFFISYKNNSKIRKLGYFIFPIMIVFALGTGQRGGFVMFVLMWVVSLLYLYFFYHEKKVKYILIILVVFATLLFALLTIFNGRVASDSNVFRAVLKRVFDDNQECAVIAFRYIDSQPVQWGRDWFLSLLDILPGKNDYLQLSYVVFGIMYGTTRGTAPPCIWGSTFYNWGLLGIVLFPFILGFAYHRLYCSFVSKPITKLRIFIFSAMFVVLGNWIADTPLVLFNQGFITLLLMRVLLVSDVTFTINGKPINR